MLGHVTDKCKPVMVLMPPRIHDSAKRLAKSTGMNLRKIYATALQEYIDRVNKKNGVKV
jgi:hypothetical protein